MIISKRCNTLNLNERFSVQRYREKIEAASMSDLKDFLENIRKFSPKVGEVAMRHVSFNVVVLTVIGTKLVKIVDKWTVGQWPNSYWAKKEEKRPTTTG